MSADDTQASFVDGLKERYESLMQSLEEKGVPSPRALVPALILILILALGFLYGPKVVPQTKTLSILVKNSQGNPIPDMSVVLSEEGKDARTVKTDADGYASFDKVSTTASLSVKVTDPNGIYADKTAPVSFTNKEVMLSASQTAIQKPQMFTAYIVDTAGQPIRNAQVVMQYDDGSKDTIASDYSGAAEFQLATVPDHATIKVSADKFKDPVPTSLIKSQLLDGVVSITLESTEEKKAQEKASPDPAEPQFGKIKVMLSGSKDLSGIRILLEDATSMNTVDSGTSDANGGYLFEDVQLGKYYITEVKESANYMGTVTDDFKLASVSGTLEQKIPLQEKMDGDYIDALVSSGSTPVAGASVYLFDLSGKKPLSQKTDSNGKAHFLVKKDTEYYITAYAGGYLPLSTSAFASTQTLKFDLERETEDNSADLKITVLENGEAADRATVVLYKSDGFFLGIPPSETDVDGVATFKIPKEQDGSPYKLFARAQRDSYRGDSSRISSDGGELQINLVGDPGTLDVALQNAVTKAPIQAGTISAVDVGGTILQTCTASEGHCLLSSLPSNSEFSIVAISNGFLQTTSDPLQLYPGEARRTSISLIAQADATSVSTKLLGIFQAGSEVKEVGNAESYVAKFLAVYPSASDLPAFHMHVSSPGNFVKITDIDSVSQSLFTSSKFSADNCYSAPENGSIASFDLIFPKGTMGARQVAVKFAVSQDAPASSAFAFNFKAYAAKKGVLLSDPAADQITIQEGISASDLVKRMCASKNYVSQVQLTSAPLICNPDGTFCRKIVFESGKQNEVPLGSEFVLQFEVLSQQQIDSISIKNSNLKLLEGSAGTNLADEPSVSSTEDSQSASVTIPSSVKTPGRLKLKAIKAGTTDLAINFNSESKAFSYHKNLLISGINVLSVKATPLTLNAGQDGRIRVSVTDDQDKPITDATVALYDCDRTPLSGDELQLAGTGERNAGKEGVYSFQFSPSTTGKIGVRVQQNDYRSSDDCAINIVADESSLSVSPQSLKFKGDSSGIAEQALTVTSTLGVNSVIELTSNCGNGQTPIIYAFPSRVSGFKDSAEVRIGVLPNVTSTSTCQLIVTQRITDKTSLVKTVPVSIDVKSPAVEQLGDPKLPAIPSVINLELDENGFADVFYSVKDGSVGFCDIKAKDDFFVTAECTSTMVHLSADYSGQQLNRSFRQKGSLQIRTGSTYQIYSLIVTAPNAPAQTTNPDDVKYYNDLPPLPNPVVINFDPYTRTFDNYYSLGIFSEPVSSCSLQDFNYGVTTDYCSPTDQRVRVLADFSGYDSYNRILQRMYGNNPACLYYYQGLFGGSMGGIYGRGQFNSYANPYSDINQYGNGFYPVPQYNRNYLNGNDYVDYSNYPYMNSRQQPYPYPQPDYYQSNVQAQMSLSAGFGAGYVDPRYSNYCYPATVAGNIVLILKSGRRQLIPIQIIGRGGQIPQQQLTIYGAQNTIFSSQAVTVDPYSLKRYAAFSLNTGANYQIRDYPLCDVAGDKDYLENVRNTQNYRQNQWQNPNFNPLAKPNSGKFANAIDPKCSPNQNGIDLSMMADVNKLSISKQQLSSTLNKDDELYVRFVYAQSGVVQIAPISLQIGGDEFKMEPVSNNLQFILTDKSTSISPTPFKNSEDIFTSDDCSISGWKEAFANTGYLAGFKSEVDVSGEFDKQKYVLKDGKYEKAADQKDAIDLPIPVKGTVKCDAKLHSTSSNLNVAVFLSEYTKPITNSQGQWKVSDTIKPVLEQIVKADSNKRYGCEIKSSSFATEATAAVKDLSDDVKLAVFGCSMDENGVVYTADYDAILAGKKESVKSSGLNDVLTLTPYSITDYPKSKLAVKEIRRPLAELKVKVTSAGNEDKSGLADISLQVSTPELSGKVFTDADKGAYLISKGRTLKFGALFPDGDDPKERDIYIFDPAEGKTDQFVKELEKLKTGDFNFVKNAPLIDAVEGKLVDEKVGYPHRIGEGSKYEFDTSGDGIDEGSYLLVAKAKVGDTVLVKVREIYLKNLLALTDPKVEPQDKALLESFTIYDAKAKGWRASKMYANNGELVEKFNEQQEGLTRSGTKASKRQEVVVSKACDELLNGRNGMIVLSMARAADGKYSIDNICISGQQGSQLKTKPLASYKIELRVGGNLDNLPLKESLEVNYWLNDIYGKSVVPPFAQTFSVNQIKPTMNFDDPFAFPLKEGSYILYFSANGIIRAFGDPDMVSTKGLITSAVFAGEEPVYWKVKSCKVTAGTGYLPTSASGGTYYSSGVVLTYSLYSKTAADNANSFDLAAYICKGSGVSSCAPKKSYKLDSAAISGQLATIDESGMWSSWSKNELSYDIRVTLRNGYRPYPSLEGGLVHCDGSVDLSKVSTPSP